MAFLAHDLQRMLLPFAHFITAQEAIIRSRTSQELNHQLSQTRGTLSSQ